MKQAKIMTDFEYGMMVTDAFNEYNIRKIKEALKERDQGLGIDADIVLAELRRKYCSE